MTDSSNAIAGKAQTLKALHDGRPAIVSKQIISDLETPVSAFLKLCDKQPYAFLLESVEGGENLGRYSIIGLKPDLIWQASGGKAKINRNALESFDQFEPDDKPVLDSFKSVLDESAIDLPETMMPMGAGLFGYFGYDLVREVEHLPNPADRALPIADAIFSRPTLVVVFDNIRQEMTIATPVRPAAGQSPEELWASAQSRLDGAIEKLQAPVPTDARRTPGSNCVKTPDTDKLDIQSNTTKDAYIEKVNRAKDYINAGDIFQVVLSQRFQAPFPKPAFELYRSLRRENPSPFLYFLNFEDHAIVGSSPEILVRVRGGEITVRPIAGTRPRGATPAEDKALEADLLADPKERAEHLMLLDLGRNDVGRAATIGSVSVTESFVIERYSHVMHIASNVVGNLAETTSPVDAVMAGFPAGTVSGAPKIRAMEIIDELENENRHSYAGAIGYFSAGGDVDTAITLRTALVSEGVMHVQAGAGIVADSDPQAEYQECIHKSRALFSAAQKIL